MEKVKMHSSTTDLKKIRNSTNVMDYAKLSPWPERNYRCSFCKKEYKSAQALGGHMNVHRRDRAKMRLSSPSWVDSGPLLNKNPNPNHIITSSSSSSPSSSSVAGQFSPFDMTQYCPFSSQSYVSITDEEKVSVVSQFSHCGDCHHPLMKRRDVGIDVNKRAPVEASDQLPTAVITKKNSYSLVWMKEKVVTLDLSVEGSMGEEKDDHLDLELRLGF